MKLVIPITAYRESLPSVTNPLRTSSVPRIRLRCSLAVMCVMTPRLLLCTAALFRPAQLKVYWLKRRRQTLNGKLVIRSTVRLVQVSVVVEDKKGHSVTNFKPEDFTLLDDWQSSEDCFFHACNATASRTSESSCSSRQSPSCKRVYQSLRLEGARSSDSGDHRSIRLAQHGSERSELRAQGSR